MPWLPLRDPQSAKDGALRQPAVPCMAEKPTAQNRCRGYHSDLMGRTHRESSGVCAACLRGHAPLRARLKAIQVADFTSSSNFRR